MEKTIDIIMEETKMNVVNVLNSSSLPPYLLNIILKELYLECEELSNKQLKEHFEEYQKVQSENEKDVSKVTEETEESKEVEEK